MKKPLEGIKVLDFTQALAGVFCAMYMGDFGADVIKVERGHVGDQSREWGPFKNDLSLYYASFNRNKRSISLNMRSEEGRKIILDLVKECDVVLENFKVGTLERLGLGYEEMKKVNPEIIYGSISGFGLEGPLSSYACYDVIAGARGGLLDRSGERNGAPIKPGFSLGDNWAGLNLLYGISMALLNKQATGRGCRLDIAMLDGVLYMMELPMLEIASGNAITPKNGNQDPSVAPVGTFKTKDGYIAIACSTEKQWNLFCDVMTLTHLKEDERFLDNEKRVAHLEELIVEIEKVTSLMGKVEIENLLSENKIACSAVKTMKEVTEDKQVQARDMIVEMNHPIAGKMRMAGLPIKFSKTPGNPVSRPAPSVGEHTIEILRELGYNEKEIESLKEKDIVCKEL